MALTEIEFELTARQFAAMDYPHLRQGQPLTLQLETGVWLPDPDAEGWYTVQADRLPARLVRVERGVYALSGQIVQADIVREDDGMESAVLLVQCGETPIRIMAAPGPDGRLPYGTWETRYLAGVGRLYGIAEEDFSAAVGAQIGVTLWEFSRLLLTPGDAAFGEWRESVELLPTPFSHDRIIVHAHLHRTRA